MDTPQVLIAQSLADDWALIAQRYAGFFYGHPTRAGQYGKEAPAVWVDKDKPWQEPLVFPDDCEFCKITSDDRVRARIAGFQKAIDIEVGNFGLAGSYWGIPATYLNVPKLGAIDLTKLPFHLQKRLCIEWNHALRDWLAGQEALEYDFEAHALVIRGAKDSPMPLVAADESDLRALEAELAADIAFATHPPTVDNLSLAEQIAQEYELDL